MGVAMLRARMAVFKPRARACMTIHECVRVSVCECV